MLIIYPLIIDFKKFKIDKEQFIFNMKKNIILNYKCIINLYTLLLIIKIQL